MSSKPSNQKTILSEAFISFSGMTLGSVFRYIFSIVMARFLGAQMLGIYSLGNAVTRIAEIFALMGLDNGVLRFVSRDTENSENVNNSIYSSLKAGLLSSIIISIILFLSVPTRKAVFASIPSGLSVVFLKTRTGTPREGASS